MKNFRNVTIKCEAEKLDELLEMLDVDYVEEIIIYRTPQEFNHDYQGETLIGLLDEDEELSLDGIEIKLDEDDFKLNSFEEEDDDFEWDFIWDN